MRVLFVTPYLPSMIRARPYNLIRSLVGLGHHVTLLAAIDTSSDTQRQADELRSWGVRVALFPVPLWRSLTNCLRALPTREPFQAVYAYQPRMEQGLQRLLSSGTFDVVHIEHLRAARLVRAIKDTPKVYDSVDCISLLFEQAAQTGSQLRSRLMTGLDLARTRRYESRLLTQFDQVVVTSHRDKDALERLARRYLAPHKRPAPITVVTNGVDLEFFQPRAVLEHRNTPTLIFSGKMSYHANVSGVLYFAREVLPHVWATNPDVRLQIVGKDPPGVVKQLATDSRIQVTGYVDDLRPFLAGATAAVCSVPYAVGVQFKVLEAMAMGIPVVCTPASFAGLEAVEGQHALVAEDPKEFAAHVLQLVSDEALARRLRVAGRRYVEECHSWEAGARRLLEIYQQARAGGEDEQQSRT